MSVCAGLAAAYAKDALAHPREPIRVSTACFEPWHVGVAEAAKEAMLDNLFQPAPPAPSADAGEGLIALTEFLALASARAQVRDEAHT